ncbi:MAG: glycosyltransferase family 4 protein [Acidobacteria bacterium]|nr:glycosyltransferase family 4 protein [Acidobacteriota bacterium]
MLVILLKRNCGRRVTGARIMSGRNSAVGGVVSETRLTVIEMIEKVSLGTGSVVQAFEAARGLAARGHQAILVTRPDPVMAGRCQQSGVEHIAVPLRHELDLRSMRRLARIATERGVDIVHVHKGIAHSVALGATFLGGHFGLVVNRGVPFPLTRLNAPKYRSRRVDRVVVVCEFLKAIVVASGRIAADKVAVVYAGVDLDRFDPARVTPSRVRTELGLAPGVPLVGVVGIRPEKGWTVVLDGFARVRHEVADARLLLVGCHDEAVRREVEARVAGAGLTGTVNVLLTRSDIPDVLAACAVVVDPSFAAGITGTIREALALEVPVVASRVGGNPELIEDGVTGLLVEPGDGAGFAAAITRMLVSPDEARSMARCGRDRVRSGFSTVVRMDRLEGLYRQVAREAQGR